MTASFELSYDPFDEKKTRKVWISLLKGITNGDEIGKKIREIPPKATVLDGKLVSDVFVLLCAINQALNHEASNSMHTKNVFTEVIYCLSPLRNITESLKAFGVNERTTHLLVISFDEEPIDLLSEIQGTIVTLETLESLFDEALIRKTYQLKDTNSNDFRNAILTKINSKEYLN